MYVLVDPFLSKLRCHSFKSPENLIGLPCLSFQPFQFDEMSNPQQLIRDRTIHKGKILFLTEYFSNLFFLESTANKEPFQKVSEIIIGKSVLWKFLLIMISCDQTSLLHRLCKCLKNTVKAKSFQRH